MADEEDVPPFLDQPLRLAMDLRDEWAGRIDIGEPAVLRFGGNRLGDAMRREDHRPVVGHFVEFVDEHRAHFLQAIVELALERFGAPVYVRHEIVHNRFVVDRLKEMGAVFVDELDEVPDDRPVVFSAHGVPKSVPAEAQHRGLTYVDATCPLVSKVHRQAQRLIEEGRHILFIGHSGHPEVIGTFGQVPPGSITLIETVADVASLNLPETANLAFLTQTTLSVDDTAAMVEALKARFPAIRAPRSEDICYATSNRQAAVKAIAPQCDRMLVIGAPNSSNSLGSPKSRSKSAFPHA